jgi:hypothetical protein
MNLDKNIIKEKLKEIQQSGSAVIFTVGEYFMQAAGHSPDTMYVEAVSHHFHSGLNIGLEAGFASLGFKLEEGGNYSKAYPVNSEDDLDKIAGEMETVFRDYYNADPSAPFEVEDVE